MHHENTCFPYCDGSLYGNLPVTDSWARTSVQTSKASSSIRLRFNRPSSLLLARRLWLAPNGGDAFMRSGMVVLKNKSLSEGWSIRFNWNRDATFSAHSLSLDSVRPPWRLHVGCMDGCEDGMVCYLFYLWKAFGTFMGEIWHFWSWQMYTLTQSSELNVRVCN